MTVELEKLLSVYKRAVINEFLSSRGNNCIDAISCEQRVEEIEKSILHRYERRQ